MSNSWRQYASKTYALEKRFIPKLIRIIKSYRNNFIRDLQTYGQSTATNNLQKSLAPYELTKAVHSIYRVAGLMGAKMVRSEIRLRVQEQKAGFGKNEQWIAEVLNFLNQHLLKFVQDITETMREDIIKILSRGVENGLSIDQIVQELKAEGLIKSRARVIARTEVNRATNVGHAVGAKTLPYEVDKQWSAARDHRTRHSHVIVNGRQVEEEGFFKVPIYKGDKPTGTFDEMLYPGDANASAANTVNCRCRVIYIPKRGSNGKLILRSTNQATVIPMRQVPRLDPAQIAAQLKSLAVITVDEK